MYIKYFMVILTKLLLLLILSASLSQNILAAKQDDLLEKGHQAMKEDIGKAIELYKQALNIDPNFEAAKNSLKASEAKQKMNQFTKTLPKRCQTYSTKSEDITYCAKNHFTVYGMPINPRIIEELVGWISDLGDQTVSINIAESQKSNRFFDKLDKMFVDSKGKFFMVNIENEHKEGSFGGFFNYEVVGLTNNDIYVIKTTNNAGGNGIFHNLLLVRIVEDKRFDLEKVLSENIGNHTSKIYLSPTTVIQKIGSLGLGDGTKHDIIINENVINVEITEMDQNKELKTYKTSFEVILE